ncbi:hypothetical protein AMECASPLE_038880, partial [Ameca splendens]
GSEQHHDHCTKTAEGKQSIRCVPPNMCHALGSKKQKGDIFATSDKSLTLPRAFTSYYERFSEKAFSSPFSPEWHIHFIKCTVVRGSYFMLFSGHLHISSQG